MPHDGPGQLGHQRVRAWYQGGVWVFDFTDSANPVEIAFFDRGPMSGTQLQTGGFWSAYWYNGSVYGTEIGRGFDTFDLTASPQLSEAALAVARTSQLDTFNPQNQPALTWPASFEMVDYRFEQVSATGTLAADKTANVEKMVAKARELMDQGKTSPAKAQLQAAANQLNASEASQAKLRQALQDLRSSVK